ncbi:MAG: hypothetical protein HY880_07915, partial [Deltaproteobacteria bacterium]|nr:hypothetical protein [Deltaproteobacteria bacterium]
MKRHSSLSVVLVLLLLSMPLLVLADPLPDVKVNSSDGPVYATEKDPVSATISLLAGTG